MRFRFPVAVAVLAGIAAAQTSSIVLPSGAAKKDPSHYHSYPFYGTTSPSLKSEGRALYMYDTNDIALGAMILKSLQVRRPNRISNQNQATTFKVSVDVSVSKNAPSAASATFATNHGANKLNVFSGNVNLPARSKTTWPEPWETAVPFGKLYLYAKSMGSSLVVEIAASTAATRTWYIEASRPETGARVTESSPALCYHSGNKCPCSLSYRSPVVGGTFYNRYNGYPNNTPSLAASVMVLGLQGRGGRFGGFTLPINIGSTLKIPAIGAGCVLATDIVTTIPLRYVTSTRPNQASLHSPTFNLPQNPWLGGKTFYTQPISLDTHATTKVPMIHSGWASKWTIGSGKGAPAATVYRSGNNTLTSGIVRQQEAATIRLNQ